MIAYEFYLCDPVRGYELVGVLPERRKKSERITRKSVTDWAEKIFGNDLSTKDIHFIQVTVNEYTGMIIRPTPVLITQR